MALPAGFAGGAVAGALISSVSKLSLSFDSLAKSMEPFVGALNAPAVQVFGQAMRDLNAVIGVALIGPFQELIRVVREVGAALLPLTRDLAPIFTRMAQVLGSVLVPLIRIWADAMRSILPLFDGLSKLAEGVAAVYRAVQVVASAFMDFGRSLLGDLLGGLGSKIMGIVDWVADALKRLARIIILGTAQIAAAFGGTRMIAGLIRAVTPLPSVEGFASPINPAFSSFSDYGRQLALRSAVAGADGGPRKTDDWLKEIREELVKIRDGAATPATIADGVTEAWDRIKRLVAKEIASAMGT